MNFSFSLLVQRPYQQRWRFTGSFHWDLALNFSGVCQVDVWLDEVLLQEENFCYFSNAPSMLLNDKSKNFICTHKKLCRMLLSNADNKKHDSLIFYCVLFNTGKGSPILVTLSISLYWNNILRTHSNNRPFTLSHCISLLHKFTFTFLFRNTSSFTQFQLLMNMNPNPSGKTLLSEDFIKYELILKLEKL